MMREGALDAFRGVLLPDEPGPEGLRAVAWDYEAMLRSVMGVLVARYERDPAYGWLDTKLSLLTGKDFPPDDPIRGRNAVYGWIQGRGLEALAGHARWFLETDETGETQAVRERIERAMREVLEHLREVRAGNGGHLFFFMTPEGRPFRLDDGGTPRPFSLTDASPYNFSDLFGAKGMYAAASYLGDQEALVEARDYCLRVDDALWQGTFTTDQQGLDPHNPVRPVPGRRSHGPIMISLGTAALWAECAQDRASVDMGIRLLRYVLERHVNLDARWGAFEEGDFIEFIDDEGAPYEQEGRVVCDPGHALEFVGLALKFIRAVKRHGLADAVQGEWLHEAERVLPSVLWRNFRNGFNFDAGGICKHFDLVAREPINADMPWWSLPETIRAALECWSVATDSQDQARSLEVTAACHNAFFQHYVRRERNLMAVQTRAASGEVVDVIPGTSDVDPGYHTNLSLIDSLRILREAP